jgi:hypothetical protein
VWVGVVALGALAGGDLECLAEADQLAERVVDGGRDISGSSAKALACISSAVRGRVSPSGPTVRGRHMGRAAFSEDSPRVDGYYCHR